MQKSPKNHQMHFDSKIKCHIVQLMHYDAAPPKYLVNPEQNRILSVVVVFPASMCAIIPTFLIDSNDSLIKIHKNNDKGSK